MRRRMAHALDRTLGVTTEPVDRVSVARATIATARAKPRARISPRKSLSWPSAFGGDMNEYPRVLRGRAKPIIYLMAASGCWICVTHKQGNGYPQIEHRGRRKYVHRFVFEDAYGPVPHGINVCHSCDNPPCINPEHLYLGTQADNCADASKRGRTTIGEKNRHAKLTCADVEAVRAAAGTATQKIIAEQFGISRRTVGQVIHRDTWRHIA